MVFRTMRYQIDFISEIEISANLRRPFDINLKAEYVSLGKNREVMTASPLSANTSAQPTSTNNLNVTVPPISILLSPIGVCRCKTLCFWRHILLKETRLWHWKVLFQMRRLPSLNLNQIKAI